MRFLTQDYLPAKDGKPMLRLDSDHGHLFVTDAHHDVSDSENHDCVAFYKKKRKRK